MILSRPSIKHQIDTLRERREYLIAKVAARKVPRRPTGTTARSAS